MPDLQKDPFAVLTPLPVPKPHLFNAFAGEKLFSLHVVLLLLREAMLGPVQFDRESGSGTVEIEEVVLDGMLAPELESGESSRA